MLQVMARSMKPEDDRESWSLVDWSKKDPKGLQKMKAEDPARYESLKIKK
ncbi:MAG: hypothetical protein DDT31_01748 [Syntrophomonadaceae bacterium]|nr:hypothetical protein [Bacillota bacterium]